MIFKHQKRIIPILLFLLCISVLYNVYMVQHQRKAENIFLSNFESVSNAADVSLRNLQQNRDIDVTKQLYALTSALSSMEATLYYGADAVGPELLTGRKGIDFGSIAALLRGLGETRGNISLKTEAFDADGRISDEELLFLHRLYQDLAALREIAAEYATSDDAYSHFVDALDGIWRAWSLDNPESPCLAFATPASAD